MRSFGDTCKEFTGIRCDGEVADAEIVKGSCYEADYQGSDVQYVILLLL